MIVISRHFLELPGCFTGLLQEITRSFSSLLKQPAKLLNALGNLGFLLGYFFYFFFLQKTEFSVGNSVSAMVYRSELLINRSDSFRSSLWVLPAPLTRLFDLLWALCWPVGSSTETPQNRAVFLLRSCAAWGRLHHIIMGCTSDTADQNPTCDPEETSISFSKELLRSHLFSNLCWAIHESF